ncbi:methyltransferase domain-containing protein [uncultured Winogradskyella sp.]|uniref:methyltransferase domain-containing protein n=1 Tax=uncultured Winogradskyella sp. TaxID=395353 RepID=UPI002638340D|nr:methyltransferase domain-containing protein [uncultured Winogradskyella sp.]
MKKKNKLNKSYWENRYKTSETRWNIGEPSTPIKTYIDQLNNKSLKILIPGAGNGYEAEYLWKNGFKNTFILDIASTPLNNFKKRVPEFPERQILHCDFFKVNIKFDLILEQTFFCALPPSLRPSYVDKTHSLLKEKGKLAGLLFNFKLTENGPPFGGSKKAYLNYFDSNFNIKVLEPSINSIKSRQGKELFFIFEKL